MGQKEMQDRQKEVGSCSLVAREASANPMGEFWS
jgi:hypothetical protein